MKANIVKNKTLREDLMDIAIAEERSREKTRPFREFLAEAEKKARGQVNTKKYGMCP